MMNFWIALHLVLIIVWANRVSRVSAEGNCINYSDLPGTNYCYNITEDMDGISAWEHCSSFDFTDSKIVEAFKKVLKNPETGIVRNVWIGFRETFRKSHEFIGHDFSPFETSSTLLGSDELCLYFNTNTENNIDWQSCKTLLPMVCAQEKYKALAYNASHPEACNETGAIALSATPGCFAQRTKCADFSLEIVPENPKLNIESIEIGKPITVKLLQYYPPGKLFGEITRGSKTYCHLPPTDRGLRLELRRNKTVDGLAVWAQHPSRSDTPKCPQLDLIYREPLSSITLYTKPNIEPDKKQTKYIWCFAQDIISGKFVATNRLTAREEEESCKYAVESSKGPPVNTTVDPVSSCLRCLKIGLTSCTNDNCTTPCGDEGCGPFKLTKLHWRALYSSLDGKNGAVDFKNCSQNHRCAAGAVIKLAQHIGDCNRDGYENCDDIFEALAFTCNFGAGASTTFPYVERERYWNCRQGNKSEFVDLPNGNGTVRYYCQQFLNEKLWSHPEYFPQLTSYISLNESFPTVKPETFETLRNTSGSIPSEDEIVKTLKTLKEIHSPLSEKETEILVKKISNISHVAKEHLKNAQTKVNVTSMPQLIEQAMLYVPDGTNISTREVSLSKTSSMGVFVSEQVSNDTGRELEDSLKQYAVNTTQEIFEKEEQIEAGVVLSGFEMNPEDKFVIMVFTDDAFIFPDGTEEGDSELGEDVVRGEINSKVVAATLTRQNVTVPLKDDAFVDIIVRAKRPPGIGQQKCCVYSDPKSGDTSWKTDGCELYSSNETSGLDVCRCNHLTHFAQLLTDAPPITGEDAKHLRRFTIAACVVSLLAQFGLLVTGVLYKKWRNKPENQVLLNMAAANTLFMALLLWQCFTPQLPVKRCSAKLLPVPSCWWTGVALHYIVLANFSWMLVCAVTHVLRIYKAPGGPKVIPHYLLLATSVGWSVPIVPVGLVLAIDASGYNFIPSVREFCYPSGKSFYMGVLTPIAIMFSLNVVAYILILKVIFPRLFGRHELDYIEGEITGDGKRFVRSIVIVLAFMFLFGLTWILGLTGYNLICMYAQCLAVFFQGPTLFCIFVLGERNIRSEIHKKLTFLEKSDKSKMPLNSGSGSFNATSNQSNDSAINCSTLGKESRQRKISKDTKI